MRKRLAVAADGGSCFLNQIKKNGVRNMDFLNKMERKFGRYAIPNLIIYLIGAYCIGFFLQYLSPTLLG